MVPATNTDCPGGEEIKLSLLAFDGNMLTAYVAWPAGLSEELQSRFPLNELSRGRGRVKVTRLRMSVWLRPRYPRFLRTKSCGGNSSSAFRVRRRGVANFLLDSANVVIDAG